MAIDDKIKDEKLQYDINSEAAKPSALSYRKLVKCEYLTDEEILRSDQTRIIEQVKCSVCMFSFRKSFWKTNKDNWKKEKKQVEILQVLTSE